MYKFGFCAMNPGSSIQLKSIGGRQTIENVPCDKNKTNTGQMLIKIVNHLNNEGYKNLSIDYLIDNLNEIPIILKYLSK